jgi:5-hydroxyisourate hydrolase-like protein (transthyretin family)
MGRKQRKRVSRSLSVSHPITLNAYTDREAINLSVRVTDGVYGQAAAGVPICLIKTLEGIPIKERTITDTDGKATFAVAGQSVDIVRMELGVDAYFSTLGVKPVYPDISIACRVSEGHGRHVNLILTPSAYVVSAES